MSSCNLKISARIFEIAFCIFFSCLPAFAAQTDKPKENEMFVANGVGDKRVKIASQYAVRCDGGKLKIDSTKSNLPFSEFLRTQKLKPDTQYTLGFKYSVDNPEPETKGLHILVRHGGNKDILWRNEGDSATPKKLVFKFRTPKGDELYDVQIHARGKFTGEIQDFFVKEGFGETFYGFKNTQKDAPAELKNIPTGAKDFEVLQPDNPQGKIVDAAEFGIKEGCKDFVKKINAALQHCRNINAARLNVPRGKYLITENTAIKISGLKNFVFDGGGSMFVWRKEYGENFVISGCEKVCVKNFKVDWDWKNDPISSAIEVVKVEREGDSYFDAKFLDYADFPNKKSRITILTGYDYATKNINAPQSFTRVMEMSKGKGHTRREWIAPNVMRVYYPKNDLAPFKVGMQFVFAHYYYDMTGLNLIGNKHLSIEDVDIYSCAGHAFVVSETQKYWQFKNVRIGIPQDGLPRQLSCAGDHCHIANSCGYFKMLDCDFSGGNDDCLNAHDCAIVAVPLAKNSLRTISGRYIYGFYEGDSVEFRNPDFSPVGFVSKIKKISRAKTKNERYDIEFADPIPSSCASTVVMFNRRYGTKNLIIKNCKFHDTKARALLLLASDTTVDNCRFENMAGLTLKIETGWTLNSWSEGFGVNNVVVKNCVFKSSNARVSSAGRDKRIILISTYVKTDPSIEKAKFPILSNILFENNKFNFENGMIAQINSASNVIFKDNEFIADAAKPLQPRAPLFTLADCENVKIINNNLSKSATLPNDDAGVYAETDSTKNIEVSGNLIK